MIFSVLRVLLLLALWIAALWFVLPADWLSGELSAVAARVLVPPLSVFGGWHLFKRVRAWRADQIKQAAARKRHEEIKQHEEDYQARKQERLERGRVFVECRGVWAALSKAPAWMYDSGWWGGFIEEDADKIEGIWREAALVASLERVLGAAFKQSAALAWLPIRLVSGVVPERWFFEEFRRIVEGPHRHMPDVEEHEPVGDKEFPKDWRPEKTLAWVEKAWERALRSSGITHRPDALDCQMLPGEGEVASRVLNLFERETLPAVLVVGMDSPLASTEKENPDEEGHAVLALVFGRAGLDALEIEDDEQQTEDDLYTPFWDRSPAKALSSDSQWGTLPPAMRSDFLSNCRRITTLHRPVSGWKMPKTPVTESRHYQVHSVRLIIQESFVFAGLCNPPQPEFPHQFRPEPEMEWHGLGWLVHDIPDAKRFALLSSAMIDCDLNPITDASKLRDEFGYVGAAHETLLLAGAIIRAAQLDQPVLLAGFGSDGEMRFGVSKPVRV